MSSSDTTAVTVSQHTTFTTGNWNQPQTLTVTGQADSDSDSETVRIGYVITGYGSVTLANQAVAVSDLEGGLRAGNVRTSQSGAMLLAEGATGSYSLELSARPAGTVTIAVSSSDTTAVTVSPSSITFTTQDWNSAKTVVVTAVEDDDVGV